MKTQGPVLIAVAVGLGLGLALAAPLTALLRSDATQGAEGRQPMVNPFAGWVEGNGEDLLVQIDSISLNSATYSRGAVPIATACWAAACGRSAVSSAGVVAS